MYSVTMDNAKHIAVDRSGEDYDGVKITFLDGLGNAVSVVLTEEAESFLVSHLDGLR